MANNEKTGSKAGKAASRVLKDARIEISAIAGK